MKTVLILFGELTDFDLDWILRHGSTQRVSTGSLLIEQGKPISGLYIVLAGLFKILAGGTTKRTIGEMGAGEVLGEVSFIDARPPTTTVQALTDSVVFAIARERLAQKLREDSAFAARFYRAIGLFLAHRLRVLTGKYSSEDGKTPAEPALPQEINEQVLDGVYLGGKRFERMLNRLLVV